MLNSPDKELDGIGIWLSLGEGYARVGGSVNWDPERGPLWVEFLTGWPVLTIQLAAGSRRARLRTTMQIRKSSWHAHLPRGRLGIPDRFVIGSAASRKCLRQQGDTYVFDFTGMSPLPQIDDLERKAVVLLDELENFRRHHPEVLARLGIEIAVRFQEESD
ncbi:hypothetical protein J2R76_005820 [Bradyrhizobium sp. USDA 4532]|uniref:hypothetical protein n=1 Tax=unclassified Bradyrhizobium TaxID=2631580 RepID=UPI00209EEF42|nr:MULTISPECIES: hypothetical protein [unclassified Bradyrhizobium]MCP1829120.1 hypothetical protein [Bradyrhizobium sp. USDA 4545]MCP1922229.1 hypothetical protein [Bradyrhizobium sp. USDA 4532]